MEFVDTHVHLCEEIYDTDRTEIIRNFAAENMAFVVDIGEDIPYSHKAVALANANDRVYAAVGAHPYSALELVQDDMATLKKLARENKKVRAIGEIGLDYHKNHAEYKDKQIYWFKKQIEVAQELDLPIIVHDRDAHEDCLRVFEEMGVSKGILHCFSGDASLVREIQKFGLYAAFGGALTYQNANNLVEAVKAVPLDKLLIETDCPYLTPEEGGVKPAKRNEPKYVKIVAAKIAEILGLPLEEVAKITTNNAKTVFVI